MTFKNNSKRMGNLNWALETLVLINWWYSCKCILVEKNVMDERVTGMKADTITTEASAVAEKVCIAPKEERPVK